MANLVMVVDRTSQDEEANPIDIAKIQSATGPCVTASIMIPIMNHTPVGLEMANAKA